MGAPQGGRGGTKNERTLQQNRNPHRGGREQRTVPLDAQSEMTIVMSDMQATKINWWIDKVLLGLLAFLMIQSYDSVQDAVQLGQDLDKRTRLIEWRIEQVERKL
jgi:hypothetical protein